MTKTTITKRFLRIVLSVCGSSAVIMAFLIFLVPIALFAQGTSTIQGHLADASGGSIPKALVKVTNLNTGVSRSARSAEDGYYRIPDLLVGAYEVRVEMVGFKSTVRTGIEVDAQSTTNLNFILEVGELSQTVNVSGEEPQVETTTARISEVISENELRSLPTAGRGILTLTMITPGITGKSEGWGGAFCCDVFSNYVAPTVSSGGTENKANYLLDGINLRYTEGSSWAAAFSPNPDAVTEVRVSTNPAFSEFGTISGPQIQIATKGGTNDYHGTGHFTDQEGALNAVPFGSQRQEMSGNYTRLFGATFGGPLVKQRLFFFGAYEGLREEKSSSNVVLAETEAFKNYVIQTRPNSIAAQLFKDYPPLRYPEGLIDEDGDGIAELGEVTVDKPASRTGKQFNGRIDYQSASARDRIYGSYWFTRPEWSESNLRAAFDSLHYNDINYVSVVHTHSFSPNSLNEARFGFTTTHYMNVRAGDVYHIPYMQTDDGFVFGNGPFSKENTPSRVPEFGDIFSLNRGKHGIKLGGTYRHSTWDLMSFLVGDNPEYYFGSILDFADDNPYQEMRGLNAGTGTARYSQLFFIQKELSFFVQNTWQIHPNLTLNYGLRWDSYFNDTLGKGRNNWQPVLTEAQVTPGEISKVINQKVDRYYNTDWNNFGPRISLAWDPTGKGKLSIRGGFAVLYDEVNTQPWYYAADNPPDVALVYAGTDRGIPIVYGLAPQGTRDFPPNPNLKVPAVNEAGAFDGTRPALGAIVTDLKNPLTIDTNIGVQYQLLKDLMVHASYRYRHIGNDLYLFDANRFNGDMVDGKLDQLNPNFDVINILTNLGRRKYHGIVAGFSKRFAQGWQVSGSYTYNNGANNFGNWSQQDDYSAFSANAYDPTVDWARDDNPHVFTLHGVWELPILRGRSGWAAGILGGWQLNTIWNFQSGGLFVPLSWSGYGEGGDFNADGQRGDRPDRPVGDVPHSFSQDEWLRGPLTASMFPLPTEVRAGNLPRDYFRGPGYARVDAALAKSFPIPIGRVEKAHLQFRAEAFNLLNRINVSGAESTLDAPNFGRATGAYQMRTMQLSVKFLF